MTALPSRFSPRQRSAAPATVLLVHGDVDLRGRLARACARSGMDVVEAGTAAKGLRALFETRPSVVAVDEDLPDMTGLVMLERVRELTDVPVLMLQGAYSEADAVRALRAGADTVLAQPVSLPETVARIEVLLRRDGGGAAEAHSYTDGVVQVNLLSAEALVNGRPLALTPLELRLLWEFVMHPRHTLSPEHLLEQVWGEGIEGRERVKIYVGYLRAKFREQGAEAPIVTVRGFGYRYEPSA